MIQKPQIFSTICFDCDSTLCSIEGIDELAERAGVLDKIAPLTNAAMDGSVPLDQIYARRLQLIRPDEASITWLAERYIASLVPGARETLRALHDADKFIHIISGGLRAAILPLANELGVRAANVHAVDLRFDREGRYAGFDSDSPLTTPGGKASVCAKLARPGEGMAMIGDGLTDIAARDAGVFVVGFGGVVHRDVVAAKADRFVETADLTATLEILLGQHHDDARD